MCVLHLSLTLTLTLLFSSTPPGLLTSAAGRQLAKHLAANQVHNVSGTVAPQTYYVYAYEALSIILQQFMVTLNKVKFNFGKLEKQERQEIRCLKSARLADTLYI